MRLHALEVRVEPRVALVAGAGFGSRSRRTSSSVWRTDRPWRDDRAQHLCLAVERRGPPSARPCPSEMLPSTIGRLDVRVEVEQPQGVRDRGAGLADTVADLLLRQAELVDELAVGERLLDRVEVGALDVLDERHLELIAVRELPDERRDPLEPGEARCAHAALAGDQLVAVKRLRHEDRLQHAVLADAGRELLRALRRRCGGAAGRGWARSRASGTSTHGRVGHGSLRDQRRRARGRGRHRCARFARSCHDARREAAGRPLGRRVGAHRTARAARRRGSRTPRRPWTPAGTGRSAGRGSAPRRGGRCAGSTVSNTASRRWRRTSSATSVERLVRLSNMVRTTPAIARSGLR